MHCHLSFVIVASLLLCNISVAAGNARSLLRTPSVLSNKHKQTLVSNSKVALPEFLMRIIGRNLRGGGPTAKNS
jgi:hypothetical protein